MDLGLNRVSNFMPGHNYGEKCKEIADFSLKWDNGFGGEAAHPSPFFLGVSTFPHPLPWMESKGCLSLFDPAENKT